MVQTLKLIMSTEYLGNMNSGRFIVRLQGGSDWACTCATTTIAMATGDWLGLHNCVQVCDTHSIISRTYSCSVPMLSDEMLQIAPRATWRHCSLLRCHIGGAKTCSTHTLLRHASSGCSVMSTCSYIAADGRGASNGAS
jgi:hypothetical protein